MGDLKFMECVLEICIAHKSISVLIELFENLVYFDRSVEHLFLKSLENISNSMVMDILLLNII